MKSIEIDIKRDKVREECGVFGFYSNNDELDMVALTHHALFGLQHRGQESAGMTVIKDNEPYTVKDLGIVSNVFTEKTLAKLPQGKISVGHVRYTSSDYLDRAATQPLVMRYIEGSLALANNGAITNFPEIRHELEKGGAIFQSNSHAEVIGYLIATHRIDSDSIEQAVLKTTDDLKGAYSLVISSPTKLIGLRDPHGFKPLCLGKIKDSYIISSESCAIDSIVGAEYIRDIEPGEMVVIDENGLKSYPLPRKKTHSLCLFEFIYVARPDSYIDGVYVNLARQKAGELLYKENPIEADIVCGVPDSGLDAAQGFAAASGIKYATAFIKNKYIGRTPDGIGTDKKQKLLKMRLNVIENVVRDKRVVIIDDSIVRGNTSAYIVKMLREAGAIEVHMRISAPEFVYPCYFGLDLPESEDMISNKYSVEELKEFIGADSLNFLSLEGLHKIAEGCKIGLCDGCFSGVYHADKPKSKYEDKFATKIKKI